VFETAETLFLNKRNDNENKKEKKKEQQKEEGRKRYQMCSLFQILVFFFKEKNSLLKDIKRTC